jgi:ABC-type uncharacterized transport system substrate-binding protein
MSTIGIFMNLSQTDPEAPDRLNAFMQGLGLSVATPTQYGGGDYKTYAGKAAALSTAGPGGGPPDLYVATCWPTLQALQGVQQNNQPPIVFAGIFDMSQTPANNPNYKNNVTGKISYGTNLVTQWISKLQLIAPGVNQVAVLYEKNDPANRPFPQLAYNAICQNPPAGVTVTGIPIAIPFNATNFENSIKAFAQQYPNNGGLLVMAGTFSASNRQLVVGYVCKYSLPAIYPNRLYVRSGGLISFGSYLADHFYAAGQYARTFLQTKNLPPLDTAQTQNGTCTFETAVNLYTAQVLGAGFYQNATQKIVPTAGLVIGQ